MRRGAGASGRGWRAVRRSYGRRGGLAATVSGERWGASGAPRTPSPAAVAWATRLPGAELADLLWDSDVDGGPPLWRVDPDGARGCPDARRLCFACPRLSVALEVGRGRSRSLRGRLLPPLPGALGLQRTAGGLLDLPVDAAGCFGFPAVPPGPARLVLRAPGRPPVVTSWVLVD